MSELDKDDTSAREDLAVIGDGWIGRALTGNRYVPRPFRRPSDKPTSCSAIIIAGGRNHVGPNDNERELTEVHIGLVRRHLIWAARSGAHAAVVLGSADVCGLAPVITGRTPPEPLTPYARLKTAVEEYCRTQSILPVTVVRLAAVHGPGKRQSERLISAARRRVIVTPERDVSTSFVTLADAVDAIRAVALASGSRDNGVISVGAGFFPLYTLLGEMALLINPRRQMRVPIRVPGALAEYLSRSRVGPVSWGARLFISREVRMEAPVVSMDAPAAARYLVETTHGCCP